MDHSQLLLEYLKEQYTQARQHETRQTAATSLLTAASGVILGFALSDGLLQNGSWWVGAAVITLSVANFWVNRTHFTGNRFHTKLAGKVRHAIEDSIAWPDRVPRTSTLREGALVEMGLRGPNVSVGGKVYSALQAVPVAMGFIGLLVLLFSFWQPTPPPHSPNPESPASAATPSDSP